MSRIYQAPPLVEALCEFQFSGGEWDWTIPGLLFEQIKDDFSIRRQTPELAFEIHASDGFVNQRVQQGPGRMQFHRPDESALIQVAPQLLVVNHLQPYPHWGDFRSLILNTLTKYVGVATPQGFSRIGLRYVNRIDTPSASFSLYDELFNFSPRLPPQIVGPIDALVMRVERSYPSDNGKLLLTLATAQDISTLKEGLVLDLDFVTLNAESIGVAAADSWIDAAHSHIEEAFEACITDNLRSTFREVL